MFSDGTDSSFLSSIFILSRSFSRVYRFRSQSKSVFNTTTGNNRQLADRKRTSDLDSDSKVQFTLEHAFSDSDFSSTGIFTTHLKSWAHCSQSNVQEPCKKSMYKVVSAAYVVIIFSYWLLAFLGYWAFGVNVNSMFQSKSESNGNTDDSRQENYIGHLKWRCNMGPPTFSPGHSFAMMSAVFVSLVESTGAYKAASRLAIATPLPAYVLSRGIGWQLT